MTLRIIGDRPCKTFWGVAVTRFLLISIFFFALNSAALADHLPGDQPTVFQRGVAAYNAGDYHQTLDLIVPLALSGLPAAQTLLGDMYRFGKGVGKDYAAAEDWYKDAATQDYLPARTRLEELEGVGSRQTMMSRPTRKALSIIPMMMKVC